MKKFLNIALLLMLTISVIGCGSDSASEPTADGSEMVNFTLNIYAGDPDSQDSRAGSLPGDDYFEQPQTKYERMRTLRVIIVRPDGMVEHNEYLHNTIPEEGLGQYDNIRLSVHGGETKRIYLFANEASMFTSGSGNPPFDFNSIRIGSQFPADEVNALQLACKAGQPLIDNSGSDKQYIPMSERFDVAIDAPEPNGNDLEQSADLFVTRAAVKFTFFVKASATPVSDYTISRIDFENVGDSEYLLPTETDYSPAKYPVSSADRYITAYSVPVQAANTKYVFTPDWKFTPQTSPTEVQAYSPAVYFPETKLRAGQRYMLRIHLEGVENYTVDVPMPNLPYGLPRNTHVQVYLDLAFSDLNVMVDVTPYKAVKLNPTFGFDELLPRPPIKPGETPPWIEFPDNKK